MNLIHRSELARDADQVQVALLFRRPAELVEVSEILYRRVFAAGVWVAVVCSLVAVLSALLDPASGRVRAVTACSLCLAAAFVFAVRHAIVYAALRRRPQMLVIVGLVFGVGAYAVGADNVDLFLPIVAFIGVGGIAAPARVVVLAGVIATVGFGVPQIADGHGNFGAASAVLVPPLVFWLIVDRIAGFALRLQQTVDDVSAATTAAHPVSDDRADYPGSADSAEPSHDESNPLQLSEPRIITVAGKRLTSRQLQVVLLACEGLRHAEIGACLGIGAQQVRKHLRDARCRADVASTAELIAWARRTGLVPGRVSHSGTHGH